MASAEDQPLDEIVWRSPPYAQEIGGIHTNTVLHYFARSPFFDPLSNNATISNQALYNPNMLHLVQTRDAFEDHLRSMSGVEFVVSRDPSDGGRIPPENHSGIWVIRKQERKKVAGREDEVSGLAEYFVVGENVFMAPTVAGIIQSRLLSTACALTKLFAKAAEMPLFTSSLGHTYYPPAPKPVTASTSTQPSQNAKEITPIPDATATGTSSKLATAASKPLKSTSASASDSRYARLLAESLSLTDRYGEEYMDETPLVGEPGSFIIQKALAVPASAAKIAEPSTATASEANGTPGPNGSAATPSKAGLAGLTLKTDLQNPSLTGEGASGSGKKRNKGGSPTTPGASSPTTPGGTRRKRKSRSGPSSARPKDL